MKNNLKIKDICKKLIIQRLEVLSYIYDEKDKNQRFLLNFSISKVENEIKDYCNIDVIPYHLYHDIVVELICAEFLIVLNSNNELGESWNIEQAIKTISMGDTNITYDTSITSATLFENLISELKSAGRRLISYRRLKW